MVFTVTRVGPRWVPSLSRFDGLTAISIWTPLKLAMPGKSGYKCLKCITTGKDF